MGAHWLRYNLRGSELAPDSDNRKADPEGGADIAPQTEGAAGRESLPPEAQRALAEAAERRRLAAAEARPREIAGREGPDPARYGDWEAKGRAVDF